MSIEAITWAMKRPIKRSSDKFLLVAFAVAADGNNICFPSQSALVEDTALDLKTVRSGIRRLEEAGYIVDIGERKGRGSHVVVWRLDLPKTVGLGQPFDLPKTVGQTLCPTKFGPTKNGRSNPACPTEIPASNVFVLPKTVGLSTVRKKVSKKERVLRTLVPPGRTKEDPDFERFWVIYPRKDAKLDARKAWTAATKLASADEIIEGLRSYPFSGEARYQKLPAGWLRDGRWMKVVHDTPPPPIEDERQRAIAEWNNMLR